MKESKKEIRGCNLLIEKKFTVIFIIKVGLNFRMQITSTPAQTYKFHDHQPTKNLLPFTESNALAFSKSTPNLTDEIDTRRTKAGGGGGSSWNPFSRQKPPRFLKEEISSPSNFVHVAGVKPSSQGFHMVGSLEAAVNNTLKLFLFLQNNNQFDFGRLIL